MDTSSAKPMQTTPNRPAGITVICILGFLLSAFLLLTAIVSLNAAQSGFGTEVFTIAGITSLITAAVMFLGFYLLFGMKKIGWILVNILMVISIVESLMNIRVIGNLILLVIWAVIIIYLWTKRKSFV